jgi:penicillin amidase
VSRRRRYFLFGLIGLLVLIHAIGIAGYFWLRTSLPRLDGELPLAGLAAPVSVERDGYGIVTIRAENDRDAYFALGFVHAQDRLFQMELMRRLGAGRLSEAIGSAMIETDRLMRTLGLQRLAEAQLAAMSPGLRAVLDSYAAGVNAFIATHEGAWPPEFYVMRIVPEPWQPADSLLWGRLMSIQLSGNWREEYLRARLAQTLTPAQLEWLWPEEGYDDVARLAPSVPAGSMNLAGASNAWAVAPSRSASGGALLAGDPHLGLRLPSYWYLARIVTPDWTLVGATAPGVPLVIIGHNERVAWSFTTTHGDTQDLFIERIDPDDPGRYLTPEGSQPFETRTETILVHGSSEALAVRATRHGPVISDIGIAAELVGDDGVVALAWSCLEEDDRTPDALFDINHAHDAYELRAALDHFHCPLQNVIYADSAGRIGFMTAGRVPVRRALAAEGQMPAEGWSGAYDWLGYLDPAELPQALDPPSAWLANANDRVIADGYPHFIAARWESPYRIERIGSVLDGLTAASVDDMTALQLDTLSLAARELVPATVAILDGHIEGALARAALEQLAAWDGHVDRDEAGPLILHAFMREADRAVFADELGDAFEDYQWWHAPTLLRLLTGAPGADEWCDVVTTEPVETCPGRLAEAFETAVAAIAEDWGDDPAAWRWGAAHRAEFQHPIWSFIPLAKRVLTPSVEAAGDTYTVNRGTPASDEDDTSFPDIHAAGLRFAVDLADPAGARYVIAGGQSGNLFSRHFDDLIPLWRDGGFVSIVGPAETVLTLVPSGNE